MYEQLHTCPLPINSGTVSLMSHLPTLHHVHMHYGSLVFSPLLPDPFLIENHNRPKVVWLGMLVGVAMK